MLRTLGCVPETSISLVAFAQPPQRDLFLVDPQCVGCVVRPIDTSSGQTLVGVRARADAHIRVVMPHLQGDRGQVNYHELKYVVCGSGSEHM